MGKENPDRLSTRMLTVEMRRALRQLNKYIERLITRGGERFSEEEVIMLREVQDAAREAGREDYIQTLRNNRERHTVLRALFATNKHIEDVEKIALARGVDIKTAEKKQPKSMEEVLQRKELVDRIHALEAKIPETKGRLLLFMTLNTPQEICGDILATLDVLETNLESLIPMIIHRQLGIVEAERSFHSYSTGLKIIQAQIERLKS